jgi:hypothetical protein
VVTATTPSGSIPKGPEQNVLDRLKDAINNESNPGYRADGSGVSLSVIIGSVALVVVGVLVVLAVLGG